MISRNQSHEYAVVTLYAALVRIRNEQSIDVEQLLSDVANAPYEELPLFMRKIVIKSLANFNNTVEALIPFLKNWKFDRLNLVTQAILIYFYTLFYLSDEQLSKAVVINIAVKVAKIYTLDEEYKFINAILEESLNR